MSLSAVLLFFVILLALVIVHEFGHFIVAKLTGMRVDEFAFGFPPRIFSKKIGETTYSFNMLPLGGYVSIWGENGNENDVSNQEAKHNKRSFGNRPWWAQILVLIAGVTMNMLLAWVIFVSISYGKIEMNSDDPTYGNLAKDTHLEVVNVSEKSPAYKAGILVGTKLVSVSTKNAVATLNSADALVSFIATHQNDPFTIVYLDANDVKKETVVAAVYGIVPDKKAVGISVAKTGTITTTLPQAVSIGTDKTLYMLGMTFDGLVEVFTSLFQGKSVLGSLSGPIGIARIVDKTSEYGAKAVLTLTAVLSINLALFNILPLPALDGGRVVVVLIESAFRRKISYKYQNFANMLGFSLLMLLLIVVTINDIRI